MRFVLLSVCLAVLGQAQLGHAFTDQDFKDFGRFYLEKKNLPSALSMFSYASDAEAKTLKALTSLALLQRDSGTVTFFNNLYVDSPANIWDARDLGYSPNPSQPNPFRAQNNANVNQIAAILRNNHLPVYLQAETDLSAFTSDTLLVPLGQTETGYPTISLDRGDILMIRALLACGRGAAYLINSQNSNILINEFVSLTEEPGPVTIEKFLAKFLDAGKLANPSDLPLARQEFKNSITRYKEASEWIRTKRTFNTVRLFNLPGSFGVSPGEVYTAGLADEAAFRAKLDEYALLLDGSRLLTGFDNKPIETLNAKPFFDGLVNLRSILPSFRKNKIRQGDVTDAFTKAGGIYPENTVARTEALLLKQTMDRASDPYAIGLFVHPGITISGSSSVQESYSPPSTLVGWGGNIYNNIRTPTGLSGISSVACGYSHLLALKDDGTVLGWGNNDSGQLNIPAGLVDVTAIAAGEGTSLALKRDGTVVAWGTYWGDWNWNGATIPQGLTGVRAIAAGSAHFLALKNDGTVVAWGSNWNGQCNIPPGLVGVNAIGASGSHSVALKSDGTVVGWGDNWCGQINIPPGLAGVTAIAVGPCDCLALKSDGTVVGWGGNWNGELRIPADLTGVIAIAEGRCFSLALKSDGTVVAWGSNWYGQTNVPTGLTGVTAIFTTGYCWNDYVVALRKDGILILNRSGDISEEIPLTLTPGGTASASWDYQFPASCLLPSGLSQVSLPLSLVNDAVPELDETIIINGVPSQDSESTFQPFTLLIMDDDGSGVGIVATDNAGKEGRMNPDPFGFRFGVYDPIRFEVRRTGSTAYAISVKISRDALLSSASTDDYEITGLDVDGQSVRIPAGSSSAEIVVSPKYDFSYPEGTESVTLNISPDSAYTLMEYSSATGSIVDASPYEWWSYQMGVLISNQSPSLDTDMDGMANLLEMALGRDPNLPDSPDAIREGVDSEGYLTLTYKRWTGGTTSGDGSYTQYGITYRPQASSTIELASWSSSYIQVQSITDTGDGMEQVVVRDTQSKSQPRRFMRVSVTL
jgi:hypothetical protein